MKNKKLAIIGAGVSGLTSTNAAIAEGLQPVVFETTNQIGGVWASETDMTATHGSAWPNMHVNTSRHTGVFSNFSWPKETVDFPITQEVDQYLHAYAKQYNLFPAIRFNARVTKVEKIGQAWQVEWQENGSPKQEMFDAVIIASGKFNKSVIPAFPGLEKIADKMLHAAQYKSADDFVNQEVLVVGGSLSGTSIAEEVARKTNVTHLFRRPRWMIKRCRSLTAAENDNTQVPRDLLPLELEYALLQKRCAEQNAFPAWQMFADSEPGFVVVEDYGTALRESRITAVRGEIDFFTDSAAVLKNGNKIDFDKVIFCTGYQANLSFLPEELRATTTFYDAVFPCEESDIAFVGFTPQLRGGGAAFILIELQARLSCAVLSGRIRLPNSEVMQAESNKDIKTLSLEQFSNSLAEKLGVLPDINSMDLAMRHILRDSAFTPARFRLQGEFNDAELAKKRIMATELYRRKLLKQNDKIPSLASLCLFKLQKTNPAITEEETLNISQIKKTR